MVIGLFGVDALRLVLVHGRNVVWAEVERPDHVEGDLAIKTEALEPDRGDLVAALVEGTDLCSVQLRLSTGERERDRRGTTDGMYGRRGHVKWVVREEKGEGGL